MVEDSPGQRDQGVQRPWGGSKAWGFKNQRKRAIQPEVNLGTLWLANYPKLTRGEMQFISRAEGNSWVSRVLLLLFLPGI